MNLPAARSHRSAFALPLVLVLALVIGIMAAVFLDRAAADRLTIERQVQSYRAHHVGAGVREVVVAWVQQNSGVGDITERIDPSTGHILDIEAPDGSLVSVYFQDGQGTALGNVTALTGDERTAGEGVLTELTALAGPVIDPALLRSVGPVRVSAATAPESVLLALAEWISQAEGQGATPRDFARAIMDARDDGEVTEAELNTAAGDAGFSVKQRDRMKRVIVSKPSLWDVGVEVYQSPVRGSNAAPVLLERYLGTALLGEEGTAAAGKRATFDPLGPFLTWERMADE